MSEYKKALKEYLEIGVHDRPYWNKLIPDQLCAKITTETDFLHFLQFVSDEKLDLELIEFSSYETDFFLENLAKLYATEHVQKHAKKCGIDSQLGYLAYVMILALGNG